MTEHAAASERTEPTNRTGFVAALLKLAKPADSKEHVRLKQDKDRRALAALRRSLQDPTGVAASACPYVVPFLPSDADRYVERVFFLVGALFALHHDHADGVSLGHLFRKINDDTAEGRQGKDNPSVRARFVALLDAHEEDVDVHVRHAISLGRAKSYAIDWDRLLTDLRSWRHPEKWVQRQLARDFWRPTPDAPRPSATPETTPENEVPR